MNERRTYTQRLIVLIASMGPLGHLPASGTATVVIVGLPFFYLIHAWPPLVRIVVTVALTGAAVWLHGVGDRILGTKDSRRLVWDELVGFTFAVAMLPSLPYLPWQLAAIALLLERAIDIAKVPPANWIEKRWPGGWGVVGDDVVAGLYTGAILSLLIHLAPGVVGLSG